MPDEAWFDVKMMQKDMTLALELGRELDVPMPTTAVANELLTAARGMGLEKKDFAAVFNVIATAFRSQGMSTAATRQGPSTIPHRQAAPDCTSRWSRSACSRSASTISTRAALMPGLAHLYIGEEAIAVGVCEALRSDDYITSTHRGHGHCLAKGATPDRMFAELLGKEAGYCKGKGGSMHIADPATGNLGANAIVGGTPASRPAPRSLEVCCGSGSASRCASSVKAHSVRGFSTRS